MNQIRYYVSRKNPLTWFAAAASLAVVVMQVLSLSFGEMPGFWSFCFLRLLPMLVGLGFSLRLVLQGPKEFYRTTRDVFWMCVYFGAVAVDWYVRIHSDSSVLDGLGSSYALLGYLRYVFACCMIYLAIYVLYRFLLTGKMGNVMLMQLLAAVAMAVLVYDLVSEVQSGISRTYLFEKIANVCIATAFLSAMLAAHRFTDGLYHPTWGDRKDGRRVRTLNGMSVVAGYIMPDRNDACNSIHDTVEISAIERYVHRKRAEGMENFGLFHVFLAAYVRCLTKYPATNRFFSGQRVYQRGDEIQFVMAVKKDMTTESPDTMIKLHLDRHDTAKDVYDKLNAEVEKVKSTPLDSAFDNLAGLLASLPGLLLKFTVWCLKVADYFGKLPVFLLELSPFHGSVIFTSMGSLGIPPIVHHLYNFGNLPAFMAVGRKYRKTELNLNGEPVTRRYVDFSVNCDERTVDGFYYATVMKYFKKLLRNPSVLDEVPEELEQDIP